MAQEDLKQSHTQTIVLQDDGIHETNIQQQPEEKKVNNCLLYTSPSPRDQRGSRMPSSA